MPRTMDEVFADALGLPVEARAELARSLLASLDGEEQGVDDAQEVDDIICMRRQTNLARRAVVTALGIGLLLGGTACDGPNGPPSIVDSYELETVDGVPLPFVLAESPVREELTAERYTFYDDRSHSNVRTTRRGTEAATTYTSWGRHSRTETQITIEVPDLEDGVGVLGPTFTLTSSGMTGGAYFGPLEVYRKVP